MSQKSMRETLERLYPGNPGMQKADVLYELARAARGGCIVEVGSASGFGTVALALATRHSGRLIVYAVDDYTERRGWANEAYTPDNLALWQQGVAAAGLTKTVQLIQHTAAEAVQDWNDPVALLFWDPGVDIGSMREEFVAWSHQLTTNGLIAINETGAGNLRVDMMVAQMIENVGWELEGIRYNIRLVRRVQT